MDIGAITAQLSDMGLNDHDAAELAQLIQKKGKGKGKGKKGSDSGNVPRKQQPKFQGECRHCRKKGHNEADCWIKDPSKKPQSKKKALKIRGCHHDGRKLEPLHI